MKILSLMKYELLKIFRNKGFLFALIIVPFLLSYLGSNLFPENMLSDYKIAVYNEDNSFLGKFGFLFLSQFFKWKDAVQITSHAELIDAIKSNEYDSILIVPKGFMNDLKNYKDTKLILVPNPNDLSSSVAIYTVVKALFNELSGIPEISAGSTTQFLLKGGISVDKNRNPPDIEIQIPNINDGSLTNIKNASLDFQDMLAPSTILVLVLIFSMGGIGISVSQTKENGLLDIYRANGLKIWEFSIYKLLTYVLLGLISSIITFYVFKYFGSNFAGKEIYMMILIILNVLMFATFGLLIASLSKTTRTTTFLLAIFIGTMVLFGDVLISIPKDSMWYKWSYILPIKYSIDSLRKVALLNYNLSLVVKDIYVILLFTVVSFIVSYISLSYVEKK
ncbi:ABC-2 type transport system permease protein [Marinitoga hydrogenitolerans DSM 16785]|uniref:ABC-2 type transport system permease protein n=1 Tax=Marinitoga hydrogenitolerans (strain DSM 16785 / JCM 12826 / AT1271) TaxID=1122195 RepID=A0A1M5ATV6_MARH1|nr:ABC transporter permease [Marinitoga hydrogenitolerans]SHF33650.1 ABC-2 type transport system permease protein [Marinitoga hydrogenitolerans DSM 16785]